MKITEIKHTRYQTDLMEVDIRESIDKSLIVLVSVKAANNKQIVFFINEAKELKKILNEIDLDSIV